MIIQCLSPGQAILSGSIDQHSFPSSFRLSLGNFLDLQGQAAGLTLFISATDQVLELQVQERLRSWWRSIFLSGSRIMELLKAPLTPNLQLASRHRLPATMYQ